MIFRGFPLIASVLRRKIRKMPLPLVYRSVDSVLKVLNSHIDQNSVDALLKVYNEALEKYNGLTEHTKKHPFIVLEGLDGSGKSTTAYKLAKQLSAEHWCTPPKSIKPVRQVFDENTELRSAYYALGNYIAGLEVAVLLKDKPVVMDRYWHSTSAYAIAQAVNDQPEEFSMPPDGDSFYVWPEDLFKPDLVLFLNVSEGIRRERLSRRAQKTDQESLLDNSVVFRNNIITAYRHMVNPSVTFINGDPGFKQVLSDIQTRVKHLF